METKNAAEIVLCMWNKGQKKSENPPNLSKIWQHGSNLLHESINGKMRMHISVCPICSDVLRSAASRQRQNI